MELPSLALQKAIVDALKADATVGTLVGERIYDQPPETRAFPYVSFGGDQLLPADRGDKVSAWECFFTIDVWSRKVGFPETKQICDAICQALDTVELTVNGFDADEFEASEVRILRDPDGKTSHGVITLHVNIAINGG